MLIWSYSIKIQTKLENSKYKTVITILEHNIFYDLGSIVSEYKSYFYVHIKTWYFRYYNGKMAKTTISIRMDLCCTKPKTLVRSCFDNVDTIKRTLEFKKKKI